MISCSKLIPLSLAFAAASLVAQAPAAAPAASAAPATPASMQLNSKIHFEDVADKAGINFTHSFGSRQLGSLLEGTGSGCLWFDYNNSGRPSLYVLSGRPLADSVHPFPLKDKPAVAPHNHLYRNDGDGHFTDVTDQAGLNPEMYAHAVTAADFDNDGFEDLLVTGYGKVVLYRNEGNGHFTDVTEKAGIKVDGWAISSTWLDYDKDGCPDLFIGRYVKFDPKYRAFYAADNYPGPLDYEGETNKLYHNNCNGTFTDVSEKSGIANYIGRTMGVTAADYDNDGWDDIYVANDRTENFLFRNKHDGTFEEVASDTGAAYGQNGESTSSMGPVFADFEGRGILDLWVTDGHYNRYLHNTGTKAGFEDLGASNGVSQANAQYVSWGTGVYDYDNDGQLDILIFHGGLIHLIPQEHTLFRGLGNDKFDDVSREAGNVFSDRTTARGACFADYDNDGKVDAFLNSLGGKGKLVHNTSENTGHWLAVKLVGSKSGRDGLGARVEVATADRKWTAERVAETGYLSQDDSRMHFGLGKASAIDHVTVRWSSGRTQTIDKPAVDQILTIDESK